MRKMGFLRFQTMVEDNYKQRGLRAKLVQKLRQKGIHNEKVLEAIGRVPRHVFFDPALLSHAYEDKAFPIGEGQTISQPFTVAVQTQLLGVKPGSKILEIGTGSGYQACILLEMGAKVYTIEYNEKLYRRTRAFLPQLGYHPYFFQGDGTKGVPIRAPYDGIVVTAGAPVVPEALIEQLANNGVLVIPVGSRDHQTMMRITKVNGVVRKEEFDTFAFVPLLGKGGWKPEEK